MRYLRIVGWVSVGSLTVLAAAAAAGLWYLDDIGVAPYALSRRIAPDPNKKDPLFFRGRKWAESVLLRLDQRNIVPIDPASLAMGANASVAAVTPPQGGRAVAVSSEGEVRAAISHAMPGDVITLAPGTYRFAGPAIEVTRPGAAAATITVRAASRGTVLIEILAREGFSVYAPYWRFENLSIRGVCSNHSDCDHAFHVVGDAHHFAAFHNDIADFNAHFKINGNRSRFPDHGRLEANTLTNHSARRTANSVTLIDLVGASDWTVRRNLIADFIKQGGDRISYGAFAKGGGERNAFEQNIVWCERLLRDHPGQRVGISLGGGGTGPGYCRDTKCITEQDDSVVASNLIASCSDDGLYMNNAARSRVSHNTVVSTAGIELRFPGTSADVEGNLIDGPIRIRNGALAREVDNRTTPIAYRYIGYRPNGGWFASRNGNSLAWAGAAPRRESVNAVPADLCGARRPRTPTYGAFEDFSACRPGSATD